MKTIEINFPSQFRTLAFGEEITGVFDPNWCQIDREDVEPDSIVIIRNEITRELTAYAWMGEDELTSIPLENETVEKSFARIKRCVEANDAAKIAKIKSAA